MGAFWRLLFVFGIGLLMTHNIIGAFITLALTFLLVSIITGIYRAIHIRMHRS